MNYKLPHTIQSVIGEKLVFTGMDGDKLLVENFVKPGAGPVMHTHFFQDEVLTVVKGKIGYIIKGQQPRFAEAGESVAFIRGVSHKFWNAGEDELHCVGYITPANSIVFFLSTIFAAQNKTGTARPALFDAAFLMQRYKSEYSMDEMPAFVKKVIIPIVYFIGKITGRYKQFKNAPAPIR